MTKRKNDFGDEFLRLGFKLNLPYNHDPAWIDEIIARFAPFASDVYFPLHPSIYETLYAWRGPKDAAEYRKQLDSLSKKLYSAGLKTNILLNANSPESTRFEPLFSYLDDFLDLERHSVTVMSFYLARQLSRRYPGLQITSSLTSNVCSPTIARLWKKEANAWGITPHLGINKKLDELKKIKRLGLKIKLLVNNDCLPDCPLNMLHHQAHTVGQLAPRAAAASIRDIHKLCFQIKQADRWLLAQQTIVPRDLPRYAGIADLIKIEGRGRPTEALVYIVGEYLKMESAVNIDWAYEEPEGAFDMISSCDRVCDECGWCEKNFKIVQRHRFASRAGYGLFSQSEEEKGEEEKRGEMYAYAADALQTLLQSYILAEKPIAGKWEIVSISQHSDSIAALSVKSRGGCHIFKFLAEKTRLTDEPKAMMRYRDVEIGPCEESEDGPHREELRLLCAALKKIIEIKNKN